MEGSIEGIYNGNKEPDSNKNYSIDGIAYKHGAKIITWLWFKWKGARFTVSVHD